MNTRPTVIVHCLAYNHAPYIRQCLEGFVMQQTSFPFYAVVHDDASTDGTADIIREYAEQYPDIIHPILETENQWRKGGGVLGKVMDEACKEATYLAYCEGDDYWTDPLKLQKQVDFLEAHPDFSICYHDVAILDNAAGEFDYSNAINDGIPEESSIIELADHNYIHTPSVMYRYSPIVTEKLQQMGASIVKDYARNLFYAELGKIKRLPESMAVYRYGVGVWTGNPTMDSRRPVFWLIALSKLIPLIDDNDIRNIMEMKLRELRNFIFTDHENALAEIERLKSTNAYKLGKLLLKPLAWIQR